MDVSKERPTCCTMAKSEPIGKSDDTGGSIIRPLKDKLHYEHLTLDNGMKIMLVHDPTAEKAACAVDVSDPFLLVRDLLQSSWPLLQVYSASALRGLYNLLRLAQLEYLLY